MNNESPFTGPDWQRRWAADQLNAAPTATAEEARTAFVRLLPKHDFVPSFEVWQAFHLLNQGHEQSSLRTDSQMQAFLAEENRLRPELEQFAESFWEHEPSQRRTLWNDLALRCAFSPFLLDRLKQLEPALEQEVIKAEPKDMAAQIAQIAQCLFVMRPETRARARQEWLKANSKHSANWARHARRAVQYYPELSAYKIGIITQLTTQDAIQKQAAKQRRKFGLNSNGTRRLKRSKGALPWWLICVLIGVFTRLFTAGCISGNTRNPDTIPPRPTYPSSVDSILKRLEKGGPTFDPTKKSPKRKVIPNAKDAKGLTEEDFKNLGLDVKIQKAAPSDRGGSSGQPPVKPPSK